MANKKTKKKDLYNTAKVVVISACIIIAFYFLLLRYTGLFATVGAIISALRPIFVGLVMAFLMNPIMRFFDRNIRKLTYRLFSNNIPTAKKISKGISVVLALITLWGLIALFFVLVIPSLVTAISDLSVTILPQMRMFQNWINNFLLEHEIDFQFNGEIDLVNLARTYLGDVQSFLSDFLEDNVVDITDFIGKVTNGAYSVFKVIIDLIIGIIVSVYVLMSKKTFKGHSKKILYALFKPQTANVILEIARKSSDIFYGFIVGKIIDSIIIGILCYIVMSILNLPYALLCSLIIGVTNIVPVFGPYIGAIPTAAIILLVDPKLGLVYIIMILVLQQVDGNIIGPSILGDSTGLSAFWVVVAITLGGSLFGFMGMLLGVPTMAVIYYMCGRYINYRAVKNGLTTKSEEYIYLDSVDVENGDFIDIDQEEDDNKKLAIFDRKNKKELTKIRKSKILDKVKFIGKSEGDTADDSDEDDESKNTNNEE